MSLVKTHLVKIALVGAALALSGAAYADSISEAEKEFVSQKKPDYEALHRLERQNLGVQPSQFNDLATVPAAPAKAPTRKRR